MSKCMYLGLLDDPVTLLDFPSEGNYCHHALPAASPIIAHQDAYCLSGKHIDCPVFQQADRKPLPKEIVFHDYTKYARLKKVSRSVWYLILLAILAALVGGGLLLISLQPSPNAFPEASLQATSVQILDTTETRTPIPHTAAASFTTTASRTPAALATTPSLTLASPVAGCTPPGGWILYTFQPADSILQLSTLFGMSEPELRLINCLEEDAVIQPGDQLFIPVMQTNTPASDPQSPTPTSMQTSRPQLLSTPTPTSTQRPDRPSPPTAAPTQAIPTARPALPSPTKQPTNTVVVQPPTQTSAPPPATPTSPPPPTP